MSATPLRPPSPRELGEAAGAGAGAGAWPGVFDSPETVERVWTDFVAAIDDSQRRADLRRALAFARARHGDQTRRGSDTPYWVHLVRVAMELARWGAGDAPMLQAALLHDTVEDTSTRIDEIAAGFGDEVADLVHWLTAPDVPAEIAPYYRRLLTEGPPRAQLLKLADRVDNVRSIQALVLRTGDTYRRWAASYLRRTEWQVLPLAADAPSVARVALVSAMADLAPLVAGGSFTRS